MYYIIYIIYYIIHDLAPRLSGKGEEGMGEEKKEGKEIRLELPFPPSLNTYWRKVGRRTLLSAKARAFRLAAVSIVVAGRAQGHVQKGPLEGNVMAELVLHPPDRRIRDIDNYAKGVLDALTHAGLWRDDSQVKTLHLSWGEILRGGKAVIRLMRIGEKIEGGRA